ncbi:4'-phosphopantetheinyl transferase family protein [Sunxiuqinia elliptica]|uniref:4'-phosphopantetheinyl transferase superfamily protein n=1 Tax=Sunxiuqinia elliptica TaxID=655355 RepID=A0A4R6HBF3_9BACT|nr:4'-phosphopantetheinyl transferase superfamily protein [Sunxiuqinia elliptica]TDO05288.1 4'-phosphopantetheinyl transferase superfamily protein [Sunxiuqinia elliptica]TDO64837.1 4'-phosphopantetheinyl transferase superfamily protein [Sunxiuqinia elliptica]
MPLVKEITNQGALLLLWELTEAISWYKKQLPGIESEPAFLRLRNERRQQEWLAVKMLLKHIGCTNLNVSYNTKGQPEIDHPLYQSVSISHSNQLAGILLHKTQQTGLDIESFERNFKAIERKYLSEQEIELTRKHTDYHCLFWCAKEAVYKMAGIAGIHFAEQIVLSEPANNQLTAQLSVLGEQQSFFLKYLKYKNQLIVFSVSHKSG